MDQSSWLCEARLTATPPPPLAHPLPRHTELLYNIYVSFLPCTKSLYKEVIYPTQCIYNQKRQYY